MQWVSFMQVKDRQRQRERERERERCLRSLQSRSCQPGISRMSRKATIGSSLYTLEDRISILIHYKWGGKKQRIQLPPVGLNIHTQEAYIKNEKHVRNNWATNIRSRKLKKVKKKVIVIIVKNGVIGCIPVRSVFILVK